MSIKYQITNLDGYLKIVAKGKDDNSSDVKKYADAIIEAVKDFKSKNVLCDERELQYSLSITDTYQLAEYISQHSSHLIKVAIVCNSKYFDDARFYETVATNRGMQIKVYTNIEEAETWLLQ